MPQPDRRATPTSPRGAARPATARRPTTRTPKSERVALRVSAAQRALLDEASRTEETTLSQFVLSAATRRAEEVLADRSRFVLSDDAWEAFVELLDRPAVAKPRLRRLMTTPSIIER